MKQCIQTLLLVLLIFGAPAAVQAAGTTHIYTFNDFINTQWVRDPQPSPDGLRIAFVIVRKDLRENTSRECIWTVDKENGRLMRLTPEKESCSHPRWSPDGKLIAYHCREQIWVIPSQGGEARKVTSLAMGASNALWSPDGEKLLFLSDVYLGCTSEEQNRKKAEEEGKNPVKARLITSLPYRVFDHWRVDTRSHLFAISLKGSGLIDLTPGDGDVPPIDLGGNRDYCFSPDSREVCYVANTDRNLAWSTNNDLFIVPAEGGKATRITTAEGNDCNPRYSPDGRYIAYTSMKRPGFEADRRRMALYDRKAHTITIISDSLDRSIEELEWAPDSRAIYASAEDEGYKSLYRIDVDTQKITQLTRKTYNNSMAISSDGTFLSFTRESMTAPPEVYCLELGTGKAREITSLNREAFSRIRMNPPEEFRFKASDGLTIHGFLVKPPDFDPSKKYPLVYLIHGGPQGNWSDDFHQRWNTELFAAPGYVVAAVNFRGSSGYGQKFTDAVSKDWGGKPYSDLMEGIDYLLAACPFIDRNRLSAEGASYGGFMINWIEGHTDRFRTLICHSGVFNMVSKYGTTEELWFPEWELGGTPYENRENYEKYSPINHVKHFRTPCLVIHGQQDYRVPVSEGMQLFTALQRNNIPSEFLYFPDECHFIRKPQNLKMWYTVMLNWLEKWLKADPPARGVLRSGLEG